MCTKGLSQQKQPLMQEPEGTLTHTGSHTQHLSHMHRHTLSPSIISAVSIKSSSYTYKSHKANTWFNSCPVSIAETLQQHAVQLKLHYHSQESAADSLHSFLHQCPDVFMHLVMMGKNMG